MWTIEEELEDALSSLNLANHQFKRLNDDVSQHIVEITKSKYVQGNPRSWWLSLRLPCKCYDYEFPSDHLVEHIPDSESSCYWIPETEKEHLAVYETNPSVINSIMELMPAFEYYVVGEKFNWLLIENDHSQLIVCHG